jgi:hypothetical protein
MGDSFLDTKNAIDIDKNRLNSDTIVIISISNFSRFFRIEDPDCYIGIISNNSITNAFCI